MLLGLQHQCSTWDRTARFCRAAAGNAQGGRASLRRSNADCPSTAPMIATIATSCCPRSLENHQVHGLLDRGCRLASRMRWSLELRRHRDHPLGICRNTLTCRTGFLEFRLRTLAFRTDFLEICQRTPAFRTDFLASRQRTPAFRTDSVGICQRTPAWHAHCSQTR